MFKLKFPLTKHLAIFLLGFSTFALTAQNPTSHIADWKNDANGAYSMIHDDYGDPGVDGIWQYADTICSNRGIKFTFGAIANSCEIQRNINGYSSPYGYAKDVMMAQHNHEIISHSHTHNCAVGNAGWDGGGACDDGPTFWGENSSYPDFNTQLVTAHNSITSNTGFEPVYYIFPYDRFTTLANNKLKDLGYIGSRTGWSGPYTSDANFHREGYENSDESSFFPDRDGFFRTAVQVFDANDQAMDVASQIAVLNNEVDNAIATGMWANRELHNVGLTGWGSVKEESYRAHVSYLQDKVEDGTLWVGTVSEILTYQIQKLKYSPNLNYVAEDDKIYVSWNTIGGQYNVNVASYLSALSVKTSVTVVVDLDGLTGGWSVKQNGSPVSDCTQANGKLYINVYPHEGELEIYKTGPVGNQSPYVDNAASNHGSLLVNFDAFTVDLNTVFEDEETADNNLVYTASGYTGVTISILNGIATISPVNGWIGSTTITFKAEDEGGLSATENVSLVVQDLFTGQSPFGGIEISIPGRVEAEDFDEGGDGVAFNEEPSEWEPSAADNPYRANNAVDIGLIASSTDYGVGFTVSGEWLEYTIDVQEDGWYTVAFNVAQYALESNALGKLKLSIDDADWMPAKDMMYTSGWGDYQTIDYSSALYLTKGIHLLKLDFVVGNVNVNYIDILDSPTDSRETLHDQSFNIFPNPTSSNLTINTDFELAYIFDQTGKLVQTVSTKNTDVRSLPEGIYFIKIDHSASMVKFVKTK